MKNKIFFSLAVFLLAFFIAGAAKGAGNLQGWLWGGGTEIDGSSPYDGKHTNLGWISMNSSNCDTDGNGLSDVEDGEDGCPTVGTAMADYGVTIPAGDGDVNGYAWSENVGWIAFSNEDSYLNGCPIGECKAYREGDYIKGWARIVSIADALKNGNSGDWKGWIKMSGTNYGVSVDNDGTLCKNGDSKTDAGGRCFAWSDELGWIDFSRASIGKTLKVCGGSCGSGDDPYNTTNIISIPEGATKNLVACYNTSGGCNNELGDVTSLSSWDKVVGFDNKFNLGYNPSSLKEELKALSVDSNTTGQFKVTHLGQEVTVGVEVTDIIPITCDCKGCNDENKCVLKSFSGADCPCSNSCDDDNSCAPNSPNWREVAP